MYSHTRTVLDVAVHHAPHRNVRDTCDSRLRLSLSGRHGNGSAVELGLVCLAVRAGGTVVLNRRVVVLRQLI